MAVGHHNPFIGNDEARAGTSALTAVYSTAVLLIFYYANLYYRVTYCPGDINYGPGISIQRFCILFV
jgi:hypothetical protein